MKKIITAGLIAIVSAVSFTSCSNCKQCSAEIMGVKSTPQKVCGDNLKQVEATPGMTCE